MQSNKLQTQLKTAMAGLKWSVAIEKQRGDGEEAETKELKWLMMLVENEVKKQGIWKEELTAIKANFMNGQVLS